MAAFLLPLVTCIPSPARAQHANDNALEGAEDAFGGSVGAEDVGVYTATNVRGFNPQQAGNARIDGVYFDQLATLAQRLRDSSTIRVGFAALDTFGPSPTGIVAWKTHQSDNDFTTTLNLNTPGYGGDSEALDFSIPVIADHLSIATGLGHGRKRYADASDSQNIAFGFIPRIRFDGIEIKPFISGYVSMRMKVRPIITISAPVIPKMPPSLKHLGQTWANGRDWNITHGVTVKAELTRNLLFRGGAFHSGLDHDRGFTEIYNVRDDDGTADHYLLADPKQTNYANSWEGLFTWRVSAGKVTHRFIAGARGRFRHRESGGSDFFAYGTTHYGERDTQPRPRFQFGNTNLGKLKQTAYMIGYIGSVDGVGQINVGLNRTQYDASFTKASGEVTHSTANPWLYNASILVKPTRWLSLYAGIATGLEDSGAASENAANRNEQLPAMRTKQVDAGIQVKIGKMTLVTSAFQIQKPYFAFDAGNRYEKLGSVRHRGIEFSATGHLTPRLHVLAGGTLMKPVVRGEGIALGLVGARPVGTPKFHGRIDLSYRTDLFDGLNLTVGIEHDSTRAASSVPFAQLGGRQLLLPARTTVDLGARHRFAIGKVPVNARFVVENVFDNKSWDTIASGAFRPAERRMATLYFIADF